MVRKSAAELKKQFNSHRDGQVSLLEAIEKPLTLEERLKILADSGRTDLVDAFKEWKPRVSKAKKRGAPLDQRVSITITGDERFSLDKEMNRLKAEKTAISMSQLIRNRAMGSVDIQEWRQIAVTALQEIEEISSTSAQLRKRKSQLTIVLDTEDDDEQAHSYEREIVAINHKLEKITAQNKKRTHRLAGRMSMAEAETVKWRAQRLHLSASDYLRMMIFGHVPDSDADSHMSLPAKRRFYLAIIDVADNGWGDVPKIYNCTQCENYMDEIRRLREQIKQNELFGNAGA